MSATKLVPDEELAGLGAQRGPGSAEAYIFLDLHEARSTGENVFAFRDLEGRYNRASPFRRLSRNRADHVFLNLPSV
jgi:hypothetical protein